MVHTHRLQLSGFQEEFGTIKDYLAEARKVQTLHAEFMVSRKRLIDLVNEGAMPLKVRGKRKQEFSNDFKRQRQAVVEQIKSSMTVDKTGLVAMAIQRYQETHGQRTPKDKWP